MTISFVHGQGAMIPLTNAGPYTSPGNSLQRSQPSSWAFPISDTVPQPGQYGMSLRLQTGTISGLKSGPTTKQAPSWM